MKKSILKGTIIIVIMSLTAKFVGLFFRIPLTNLIGDYGIGLFTFPMKLFLPIVALITSGPSIAIAKLISENDSVDNLDYMYKIKHTSFRYMFYLGCIVSFIMLVLGVILVQTLWPKDALYPFLTLLPAPMFLSFTAVYKGYYQGRQNMYPIAFQQLADALGRVSLGLLATLLLLPLGVKFGAAGGTFGTTAGAVTGLMLYFIYYLKFDEKHNKVSVSKAERKEIFNKLYKIALPVSVSAIGATLIMLIDTLFIKNRLLFIGYTEESMIKLNGILSNVDTLMSIPLVIGTAISLNALPNIVAAKSKGIAYTQTRMRSMMILIMCISLPCGVGLFLVGKDVFSLLFSKMSTDHYLIEILSVAIIFMMINLGFTSILQALNHEKVPVRNMYIGLIIKLISSFILLSIASINIHGAAISTLITYLVICILNGLACFKLHFKIDIKYMIVIPIISTFIMGLVVYILNTLSAHYLMTLFSILVGAGIYATLMIVFKVIDIKHIPILNKIK